MDSPVTKRERVRYDENDMMSDKDDNRDYRDNDREHKHDDGWGFGSYEERRRTLKERDWFDHIKDVN